ncbi:MAG TPA: hypothetical protein VHA33_16430 [Candidatus Angelobacter sp.]|nr:hypothetical protein [Candidatus Angelobacter sp.]
MASISMVFAATLSIGQSQAPSAPSSTGTVDLAAVVKQQFGSTFTLPKEYPTPLITADFDGDGIEDVAIVADSKEPMPDSYEFKYTVADPYNSYFGFGNPAVTSSFNTSDPKRNHALLVIFGAGADSWRAATPKAKFVMINVPFDSIEVGRMLIKKNKPPIFVIKTRESQIMDSAVFWDVKKKKWKWEPGNTVN